MKATLNLRFDKHVIEAAKEYAFKNNTSLSKIIEGYLKGLVNRDKNKKFISDDLIGILEQYKDLSAEEIRDRYVKGRHHA